MSGDDAEDKHFVLRVQKEKVVAVDIRPKAPTDVPASKAARARALACDRELGPAQIRVWEEEQPLYVSQQKTMQELTREAPEYDTSANILGRTYSTLDAQFHLRSKFLTRPGEGFTCMKPSVDVTIKLSDFKVAVAREFEPGTCSFKHILKHEYRHVAVNRNTLHLAAETLTKELHAKFDHKVFFGTEPAAKASLNQWFSTYGAARIKELLAEGLEENKRIDSPEEYAENKTACNGEIHTIVSNTRRKLGR